MLAATYSGPKAFHAPSDQNYHHSWTCAPLGPPYANEGGEGRLEVLTTYPNMVPIADPKGVPEGEG